MNIDLHIDRLILDGIDIAWHERPLLRVAIEAELTRLLEEGGITRQGSVTLRDVPAAPIHLPAESDPARIGRQIARSVYGGLNQ